MGDPDLVAREYHELNFGRLPDGRQPRRGGTGSATAVRRSSTPGSRTSGESVPAPSPNASRFHCACRSRSTRICEDPLFGFRLTNEARQIVVAARTDWELRPERSFRGRTAHVVRMRLTNFLAPGRYAFTPGVARSGLGDDALDIREDYTSFIVHGTNAAGGSADLPYELEIEPA